METRDELLLDAETFDWQEVLGLGGFLCLFGLVAIVGVIFFYSLISGVVVGMPDPYDAPLKWIIRLLGVGATLVCWLSARHFRVLTPRNVGVVLFAICGWVALSSI
jgi:hypothetical protein